MFTEVEIGTELIIEIIIDGDIMDNKQIDITAEGDDLLELALKLVWNTNTTKAIQYMDTKLRSVTKYYGTPTDEHITVSQIGIVGVPTLILFSWDTVNAINLPYPMDLEDTLFFVKGWLKHADYGEEPDHDGCNNVAWRVFTENWGHVAGYPSTIMGVQPKWAMYGK